ncbi:hypothetical protein HDU76_006405 [Blyttiomyces sp. JEL0837]|nr:hypothetical protein HDU76_006405 [Blyttiomyces sp. JEL0837]
MASRTVKVRLPAKFTATPHSQIQSYITSLVAFLSPYQWLLDIHAYDAIKVGFFTSTFPEEWRPLATDQFYNVDQLLDMTLEGRVNEEWPVSLKEFVRRAFELKLPRDVDEGEFEGGLTVENVVIDDLTTTAAEMSRKKLHEVDRFSNMITTLATRTNITRIIDVGAGQGYLTHRLSQQFPCIAVDFDTIQTSGAEKRGKRIKNTRVSKTRTAVGYGESNTKEVLYRTIRVNAGNLVSLCNEFGGGGGGGGGNTNEVVGENGQQELEPAKEAKEKERIMLVGLHACGDLSASSMLKAFRDAEDVAALAVVPCCFNLLTEPDNLDEDTLQHGEYGFPLSKTMINLCREHQFHLGHRGRNLGCQTFEKMDRAGTLSALSGHYKRSLLDAILWDMGVGPNADGKTDAATSTSTSDTTCACNTPSEPPTPTHSPNPSTTSTSQTQTPQQPRKFRLGRLPPEAYTGPFTTYALAAFTRLQIPNPPTLETLNQIISSPRYINAEKEITTVYLIRSVLARVVESLLLMDRVLFLMECEYEGVELDCGLLNLFDVNESPRNMVVLAEKKVKRK